MKNTIKDTRTNIKLISSDLDGTLLGNKEAEKQFRYVWNRISGEKPFLCYNTGRMLPQVKQLVQSGVLPEPDYIISGVGTDIYDYKHNKQLKAISEILDENWSVDKVEQVIKANTDLQIEKQPAYFQTDYKSSWFLNDAPAETIEQLQNQMEDQDLQVHIVYSNNRHLDILPKWANKGNALKWLIKHLSIKSSEILVAGDSGNDNAMFQLHGVHGIVVGNAQPELIEQTTGMPIYLAPAHETNAWAVLAGLYYYGIIDSLEMNPQEQPEQSVLYESIRVSGETEVSVLSTEQIEFIQEGYHKAVEALKRTITPRGFTACSIRDNESIGSDANYESVWSRDGAITILGSLSLLEEHEDIHQCQRNTLKTLIENISINGQIPANVRIADGRPEYSGIGGIASIDSGMWLIIGFYAYVSYTRDIAFLREHLEPLQRAMNWLSAHDSNNDSLLEIPEGGDWTDLFDRSYNVLYDEVLWYRCNVCFARILQLMGEEQRAGDYLRWARVIKKEIINTFWPTTQEHLYQSVSFSEKQFSIGDARYLIAQTSPFDFSWRCDTLGNLLAYLFDVTETARASQTFRFLWGVGVNEPYPVANLYPVVSVGDNDWRDYYAVNLLNLPNHYHNGGIWPFIGGYWVRFVHKLGLHDLALQELYRLAQLNKLGVMNEWEFNEWAHGQTGRPMGKAYQAWSISEFIRACHSLNILKR